MADNKHIHYRLLQAGYSHRQSVLILYAFSALFGLLAILFSNATQTVALVITALLLLLLHIFADIAGLVADGKQPDLHLLNKPFKKKKKRNRQVGIKSFENE